MVLKSFIAAHELHVITTEVINPFEVTKRLDQCKTWLTGRRTVHMDVVLGKLEVPLLFFFLYGCIFFVRSTRARLMVSIKCILGKLAQKLSAFSLALEPREYKLLVMGDGFQIAPTNSFCCRHGQSWSDRDSGEFGFSWGSLVKVKTSSL